MCHTEEKIPVLALMKKWKKMWNFNPNEILRLNKGKGVKHMVWPIKQLDQL